MSRMKYTDYLAATRRDDESVGTAGNRLFSIGSQAKAKGSLHSIVRT